MQKNRMISAIIKGNFAGWIINYKIYIVVILLTIFTLDNYANVFKFAQEVQCRVTPFLFPFLFTHPFMKLVVFTCVIFAFSNAPFVSSIQLLLMSRSGKSAWYLAQIIYVAICTIIITMFLIMLPIIRHFNLIVIKGDWGKVWINLANNYEIINPSDYTVISRYSASETMLYTVVMFILVVMFIAMILMFFNTVFPNKGLGIVLSSIFVILEFMYTLTGNNIILWISPISWINISNMSYSRENFVPSIKYGVTMMIVLNMLLIIGTYMKSKRKDIAVIVDEI